MSKQKQTHTLASELSGASSSSKLPQTLTAADMAPWLKSKDSNKASDLNNLKTDFLNTLKKKANYKLEDSYHYRKT